MAKGLTLKFVALGILGIAAVSFSIFANAARERAAVTTELSAQGKEDPKHKKPEPQKSVAPRQAPRQAPVRVAPRQAPVRVAPRQATPRVIERHETRQGGNRVKTQTKITPPAQAPRIVTPNSGTPKSAHRVFTPRSNNSRQVTAARIRGVPMRGAGRTSIAGRNYSVWRSGYRLRRGGSWHTFVALGTLGVLTIGNADYYPYAYIDAPADYCDGLTEDGCQLVYDEVETLEGDTVAQCVAYCPWQ